MADTNTVGFVGIGNAGRPMAANLAAAGHQLVLYDIDVERARDFAGQHGCAAVGTLAELAAVDVLFTMVPDGTVVRDVLFGDDVLADQLRPGTVVVDTSSSDPAGTRELSDQLRTRGIALVDAPVSVPEVGVASEGRITFMVGTDDEAALARVRPLLEVMGAHVFCVGGSGAGHATKTLNNYVSASGLYGALDALMVGYRHGLDPATMLAVLNLSTGRNFSTQETLRRNSLPRRFDTGYSLALLVKDLRIAQGFLDEVEVESELVDVVLQGFAGALEDLGGDEDLTGSLRHWEHRAGFELPPAPVQDGARA
jgi:3-hydroxyisobutyrate dehydrogenase-like beta-hydroxyacid dehydrogenase